MDSCDLFRILPPHAPAGIYRLLRSDLFGNNLDNLSRRGRFSSIFRDNNLKHFMYGIEWGCARLSYLPLGWHEDSGSPRSRHRGLGLAKLALEFVWPAPLKPRGLASPRRSRESMKLGSLRDWRVLSISSGLSLGSPRPRAYARPASVPGGRRTAKVRTGSVIPVLVPLYLNLRIVCLDSAAERP